MAMARVGSRMTDLSIIIVNWNTRALLQQCLEALPAAAQGLDYEIFVVDNGSRDGSAALVRKAYPQCRLLDVGRNLGFSAGNNLALGRIQGRHVLLLNPDTVCHPGSLKTLRDFLEKTPDAGAVGPQLVSADGEPVITWGNFPAVRFHLRSLLDPRGTWLVRAGRAQSFVHIPARGEPSRAVDYVAGACMLMRGEALASVGSLDERFFMYFEETDWCRRAWAAGWRVYYCAEAQVAHLEGKSAEQASEFSRVQFQHSYRLFVDKHYGAGRSWQFRAAILLEYAWKGLLRACAPRDRARNRKLAATWWRIAGMQLRPRLAPTPPV
jgi:GT2 family glycosyltransferase